MHEAWEATREHFLSLKEEPSEDEEEPNNPAYDAPASVVHGQARRVDF